MSDVSESYKKNYTNGAVSGQLTDIRREPSVCWGESELLGSLKMNTALEYSTRVVQEGDRRCNKSTLNDLAYLTPLRIPLMNPVNLCRNFRTIYGG
jgi:hypothetical protein